AGTGQSPPEAKQRPARPRRKSGATRSNHTELATMGGDPKRRIQVGRPDSPAERTADTAARTDSGAALDPATMSLPASRQDPASAPRLIRSVLSTPGMPLSNSAQQRLG